MAINFVTFLIICSIFVVSRATCEDDILSFNYGFYLNVNESNGTSDIASRLRMKIYIGSSIENSSSSDISLRDTEMIFKNIDHTKPLVIYIHGFREHPSNESIRTIVGAYLQRGTDNIMLLDWSDLALGKYITVVTRLREIARILAQTYDDLVQMGLKLKTSHIVGHSLGAHIAGFVGKRSRNLIPRITGLDPAKPGFYHPGAEHIDADSAKFVDVIHTDGGFYGASVITGTVDFIANHGTRAQPGCPLVGFPMSPEDFCSHWRSWRFYAESVLNEYAFPAFECTSYVDFALGKCASNRRIHFGYSTATNAHGSYYFMTNDKSPFGMNSSSHAPLI